MTLAAERVTLAGRLKEVSVRLAPGHITAICGPNGAGKSSLLQVLAGLERPDSGSILLEGDPLSRLPLKTRAQRIGYLPQAAEVAWDVSVRSLVVLGRMPHGDRAAEPVDAALNALDLQDFVNRRVLTLSGGERARVLLARVLAGEPRWILADEPLAALDLSHQAALLRYFRRATEAGTGVVLVLHDLAAAMNWADRVLVLDRSAVAVDGVPAEGLSEEVIARVWDVQGRWIGEDGGRAFVTYP